MEEPELNGEVEEEPIDYERKYEVGEYDPVAGMVKPKPSNVKRREFNPEWTKYIAARAIGIKAHKRSLNAASRGKTQADAEAEMLEQLVPKALKVLKQQLASPDERVQQSAAVKVLEYARGKPVQKMQTEFAGVSKIVYESAAWQPGEAMELEGQALEILTLPMPDGEEDDPAP